MSFRRIIQSFTGRSTGIQSPSYNYIPLQDTENSIRPALRHTQNGSPSVTQDEEPETNIVDEQRPTEEEKLSLRRVADNIPFAAFTIVIVELCERFAYYGLSGVYQNYLQNPLPAGGKGTGAPASVYDPVPAGALGLGQAKATGLQQGFAGLSYVFPLFAAILADTKWGRYKTISYFCGIYFVGLVIITLTSLPASLSAGYGLPGWLVGAFIVSVGTGGIKANVSPLVADQYRKTEMSIRVLPSGERVIVDPDMTISRIYNLFYWCINIGSLSSGITTILERRVGFWAAFALPTCVFVATPIILVSGSHLYYKVPPRGSIVLEVYRVARLAFRGALTRPRKFFREARISGGVWNRAKPSVIDDEDPNELKHSQRSWVTWDDAFVDEVQRTARACQILLFFPLYWLAYGQISTNLVSMAGTMTTHGLPNDLLANANPMALILLIPAVDMFALPALRSAGVVVGPVRRIWLGFMFAALAMAYSAVLQHYVYATNPCGHFVGTCSEPSSISVWFVVPSFVLIAISEIFASITSLEYAYNKAPKRMKSVVMSLLMMTSAAGSILNVFISPFSRDPNLVTNYTCIAIATFIAGNVFCYVFRRRDLKDEAENALGRGESRDTVTVEAEEIDER